VSDKPRVWNVKALARQHTEVAIQRIAGLSQNAESESVRLDASKALLDRGWGSVAQKHKHSGDDEDATPLQVNLVYRPRTKK